MATDKAGLENTPIDSQSTPELRHGASGALERAMDHFVKLVVSKPDKGADLSANYQVGADAIKQSAEVDLELNRALQKQIGGF